MGIFKALRSIRTIKQREILHGLRKKRRIIGSGTARLDGRGILSIMGGTAESRDMEAKESI